MRVVVIAQGSQGDVAPVLPLGRALVRDGHKVVVLASPGFEEFFSRDGIEFRPVGPDVKDWLRENRGKRRVMKGGVASLLGAIRRGFEYYFRVLPPEAEGADLLLGAGVDFSGRSVAEHLGIPYRYLACVTQLFRSSAHPPMMVPFQPRSGFANRVLWSVSDFAMNRLLGLEPAYNRHRADWGLKPIGNLMGYMVGRSIVATDPELAPMPADVRAECVQVGYLHDDRGGGLSPEAERFLDAGPPPVFVGFGSMPGAEHGNAAVRELVESSQHRLIVSKGWADLAPGAASDRVLEVGFVPYLELFPRLTLVVHHGGSGTTHCAARAGVPQLVVPHMLDQPYWGKRVHELGLGPKPLKWSRLSGRDLRARVDEAVGDPGYRERARELSEKIRRRDPLAEAMRAVREATGRAQGSDTEGV